MIRLASQGNMTGKFFNDDLTCVITVGARADLLPGSFWHLFAFEDCD